ncbi:hypothetical protein Tco_0267168 [Tanacetum coccineum]
MPCQARARLGLIAALESVTSVSAVATSEAKTSELKHKSVSEPLIKDWISNSEDENDVVPKLGSNALGYKQWEVFNIGSSVVESLQLTMETSSSSGNHVTNSGNALAFYS